MKLISLTTTTAVVALSLAAFPAGAVSFDKVTAAVDPTAFDEADAAWRRLTINRSSVCGAFGNDRVRRIDLIIDKYNALAEAVQSNDEAAATAAGKELTALVRKNERFAACWRSAATRVGISRNIVDMF
jgi:uncharacterized protein YmfQ (DUF2313 family)